MALSQDEVRQRVQEIFIKHRSAWIEMSHDDKCIEINKKYSTTLAGLSNVLISDIYTQSNIQIEKTDFFEMLNDFLDKMSEQLQMHPGDCIILLSKLLSDMMVQQTAIFELNQEKGEN
jgi:hypothetical protein